MKRKFLPVATLALASLLMIQNNHNVLAERSNDLENDIVSDEHSLNADEKEKLAEKAQKYQDEENEIIEDERNRFNEEVEKYIEKQGKKQSLNISLSSDDELDLIKKESAARIKKKLDNLSKKQGWVDLTPEEVKEIVPYSEEGSLELTDYKIQYIKEDKMYKFSAEWEFIDPDDWDIYGDGKDFVAMRSTEPLNYIRSFCRSQQYVVEKRSGRVLQKINSGYDEDGKSEGNTITKKYENLHGVIWNVRDYVYETDDIHHPTHIVHDTAWGRASTYFKPRKSSERPKLFMDFEHNWLNYKWSTSFSISGVNLTGSGMSISYDEKPNRMFKTSKGRALSL
ncbi:hypothetical protein BLGI_4737 [Brevibacillus laterosporus GI-9]|uniref:hypothetical protein n=1 Tax=Brevibacillus laterosporus TaxID=1465 RepID=UPI0002405272|nr:hypothetical protein [Brevibacillus laterosporus]CCF16768.1 hypothetical protein BLGI_4737 [Brevibacillus laterosporus GI-9]